LILLEGTAIRQVSTVFLIVENWIKVRLSHANTLQLVDLFLIKELCVAEVYSFT
jgi:hypothetical protein